MSESHARSVVKGLTWRFVATLTTIILVYVATGSLQLAAGVGIFDVIIKLALYYLHERAWLHVAWGKWYDHKKSLSKK